MSLQGHGLGLGCRVFVDDRLVHEDRTYYSDNVIEMENLDGSEKKVIPMRSFTGGFLESMVGKADKRLVFNAGSPAEGDYGGNVRSADGVVRHSANNWFRDLGVSKKSSENYSGIQIGYDEGAAAVNARDYTIPGLITTAQIQKYEMRNSDDLGSGLAYSFGKDSSHFYIQRVFFNHTASSVQFNTCGIFANGGGDWSSGTSYTDANAMLFCRDTFNTVTIAPGTGKIIRYKFSLTKKDPSGKIGFVNNFLYYFLYSISGISKSIMRINGTNEDHYIYLAFPANITASTPGMRGYESTGTYATHAFEGGIAPSVTGYDLVNRDADSSLGTAAYSGLKQAKFTPVTWGNGNNKLYYNADTDIGSGTVDPVTASPGKCVKRWRRRFDNNGSVPVTIKSIAVLIRGGNYSSLVGLVNLGESGITIPAASSMTAEITFGIEV